MTNTLHRFGDAQSFRDDYIVFAIASRGKNDENSVPKLRRFLEIAMQFKPVNLGDSRHGGAYRPSRSMSPLSHWNRDTDPDFQKVIDGFDTTATAAAVFDNLEAAEQCTKAVREADLGLSINISTSVDGADRVLQRRRHSASQRGLLARLRRQDRAPAERRRAGAVDDVRPRYGEPVAREEDDRLGEGRPANTGCRRQSC